MAQSKGELSDSIQQLMRKGNWKKALAESEKLCALDKDDPLVALRIGDIYQKMGDRDNAARNYVKSASLFAKQGHTPKALATYKMVLRIDPSLTEVQGMIDELVGRPQKHTAPAIRGALKVDLAKAIPGLEDAPQKAPGPQPVKETEEKPVYELEASGGAGGYGNVELSPGPSGRQGGIELTAGGYDGPGMIELDTEGADLETARPDMDFSGGPVYELDTGRADAGAASFDDSVTLSGLDTGRAPLDEPDDEGVYGGDGSYGLEAGGGPTYELDTSQVYSEAAFDEDAEAASAPGHTDPVPPPEEASDEDPDLAVIDELVSEGSDTGVKTEGPAHASLLFSDLSHDEMWEMFGKMKRHTFGSNEKVVREGEEGDSLYIIKKGRVRVVTRAGSLEVLLARLGERDFFGEVSFLTGRPRTADVIADEPCEIMELTRNDLNGLIKRHPRLEGVLKLFYESRVAETLSTLKAMPREFFE